VESLPYVTVQKIPYVSMAGEMFKLPGPFSYQQPATKSEFGAEDIDDLDDTESVNNDDDQGEFQGSMHQNDRFVVKSQFGHVRIQPVLEILDKLQERNRMYSLNDAELDVLLFAGHCVLPPDLFEACLAEHIGEKHPFAGKSNCSEINFMLIIDVFSLSLYRAVPSNCRKHNS
jgi:hypothetical protein